MSVITVNNENFEKEILQSRMPVLLDFWATWCGPCRMMSPVVDEIAESMNTSIKVGKINIDECPNLAEKYGVMSIPTFVVLKNGVEAGRTVGVQSREEITKLIS
ncbi:MAG: thioredoxin [Clostridia bacterium]|nr:thioredoxin [Clostridia bacterium]